MYSNNQITFENIAGYTLSKSDFALWFQYLLAYSLLLTKNFPITNISIGLTFPLCEFQTTITNQGTKSLGYLQQTSGTDVLKITYLPIATSAAFEVRASPMTISMQEFFMTMLILPQYANQVALS